MATFVSQDELLRIAGQKAALTPLGGTVAHGFLTLSLLPVMSAEVAVRPEGLDWLDDDLAGHQRVPTGFRSRSSSTVAPPKPRVRPRTYRASRM